MGKINYYQWINGNDCCCNDSRQISGDACSCDQILLEISNLHTDDEVLQNEIDDLSGDVSTKLDASAYTPVDLTAYATKQWVEDKGYITTVQPLKTINGESIVGEGNIVISGGSIDAYTKTEADNRFQPIGNYLTEHQPLKTINGNVISGTGNIEITCSGGSVTVDDHLDSASTNPVQNKVITEALNGKLDESAYTPTDLSNYVTTSELNQYVLNLQEQINSLISSISGCCGETGETQYRWVTMTGENDYWCSGTTKYSKEKEQESTDGINWVDVNPSVIRNGSTILEEHCTECGYSGGSRIQNDYSASTSPTKIANICSSDVERVSVAYSPQPFIFNNCITSVESALTWDNTVTTDKSTTIIEAGEYADTDLLWTSLSSEITEIGDNAFSGNTNLSSVTIGNYSRFDPTSQNPTSNISSIGNYAFKGCTGMENIQLIHSNQVPTLGTGAFDGCTSLNAIYVKREMESAFKQASGWSTYASIIVGI